MQITISLSCEQEKQEDLRSLSNGMPLGVGAMVPSCLQHSRVVATVLFWACATNANKTT